MAFTFINPEQYSRVAAKLIQKDLVVANTFGRSFEADFQGDANDTISIPVPASLVATRRALRSDAAITTSELTESKFTLSLSNHVYQSVDIRDYMRTFDVKRFLARVLAPQAAAVARDIEFQCVELLQGLTASTTLGWDAGNPLDVFFDARKELRDLSVPADGMVAVVGTGITHALLKSDNILRADQSGTSSALRSAQLGSIAGFNLIESNRFASEEIALYHRDAVHLALRTPIIPEGVAAGGMVESGGMGFRVIYDYDATYLKNRSTVDTYTGVGTVPFKNIEEGTSITAALHVV